jgi:hypothetical protein
MVGIKTCRLTRNPQLGDPVAWLNLTLADGRELDDVALHRSPGGRWFFQGWGGLSAALAAMVGRAMHRAATAPDDRLRHETGHEAAGRQAIRDQGSETTIGWPGCAVG